MDHRAENAPSRTISPPAPITAWWLGRTLYRDAWDLQHRLVAARVADSIGDQLLLLEHEPVLFDTTRLLADGTRFAAAKPRELEGEEVS